MTPVHPARHLLRAKDLIDARYREPLDVAALARAAHLSPAHFSREFRRAFGEPPHQYLLLAGWSAPRRCCATPTARSRTSASPLDCAASGRSRRASAGRSASRPRLTGPPTRRRPTACESRPASCARARGRSPARFEKTAACDAANVAADRSTTPEDDHAEAAHPRQRVGSRPGRRTRLLHREARAGAPRRRHRARDGQLPLAHRRPARTGRRCPHPHVGARPRPCSMPIRRRSSRR
jgi:hypothetical protein